jgi:hypothetical protein
MIEYFHASCKILYEKLSEIFLKSAKISFKKPLINLSTTSNFYLMSYNLLRPIGLRRKK